MDITLISVPMDLGADRRGVDMGPSAIRYADIVEKLRALGHRVTSAPPIPVSEPEADLQQTDIEMRAKHLAPIVASTSMLAERVAASIEAGSLPITLGGDHSIGLGSIAGASRARNPLGVIWFDAHADFNTTSTTPSGNVHGMILAALAGLGEAELVNVGGPGAKVDPKRIVIVGARDLDPGEQRLLREAGAHVLTMSDIDRRGMEAVTREALELALDGANGLHVSFDLDVVDPSEAPGVGTPVHGGITYREAHLAMEMVAESGRLTSFDLVEVNPILDHHNQTAILATELALSAVGKRIY
ncbi:MAG TPA: arginase [Ktedonobacterales bacterium]|jgi:arginase|nr:arginase [Ktedonobacterales bacterium]